jgi:hypothetical protein
MTLASFTFQFVCKLFKTVETIHIDHFASQIAVVSEEDSLIPMTVFVTRSIFGVLLEQNAEERDFFVVDLLFVVFFENT